MDEARLFLETFTQNPLMISVGDVLVEKKIEINNTGCTFSPGLRFMEVEILPNLETPNSSSMGPVFHWKPMVLFRESRGSTGTMMRGMRHGRNQLKLVLAAVNRMPGMNGKAQNITHGPLGSEKNPEKLPFHYTEMGGSLHNLLESRKKNWVVSRIPNIQQMRRVLATYSLFGFVNLNGYYPLGSTNKDGSNGTY